MKKLRQSNRSLSATVCALCAAAGVGLALPASGQPASGATAGTTTSTEAASTQKLDRSDRKFLEKAAESGMAEVTEAKTAQQKGSSDAVKQFAQRMETDHTKANDELKQLAGKKGVTLPTELARKHERAERKLEGKSGADFDKAYAKAEVKDHKDAVKLFEKASKSKDADIKAFADKTLPTLREHLQAAQDLEKGGAAAGTRKGE